ncbi:hypothetical protein [Novosphingobium sp.]|uniref:hypothetical protein n=1 Tax=Novosphingobium sp. TaxID=1874826 RepID=UPI003D13633B
MQRHGVLLMALCVLSGCSSGSDPGPGGVTKDEARQLDAAAAMLDKRPAPPLVDATVPADINPPRHGEGDHTK